MSRDPNGNGHPEHPSTAPLSIHDMTVAYHRRPVLWDIDYNAPPGQLIAIIGPNGSGKTTLIKAVLDLVPMVLPDSMGAAGTYEGTYIGMLDHNATTIALELGGKAPEQGLNGKLKTVAKESGG